MLTFVDGTRGINTNTEYEHMARGTVCLKLNMRVIECTVSHDLETGNSRFKQS